MDNEITPRPRTAWATSPAIRRKKRDDQIQRLVRQIRKVAGHTDSPAYAPLLRRFAELCILAERAYQHLRDAELLNPEGELRSSLTTYRQICETSRTLARELGLSPTVAASFTTRAKILDLEALRNVTEE
jgi:hypothetical protein